MTLPTEPGEDLDGAVAYYVTRWTGPTPTNKFWTRPGGVLHMGPLPCWSTDRRLVLDLVEAVGSHPEEVRAEFAATLERLVLESMTAARVPELERSWPAALFHLEIGTVALAAVMACYADDFEDGGD